MTENDATPDPASNGTPPTDWDAEFAELEARYPKVRKPTLVAVKIVGESPDIELDDAKAQAAAHGKRITAASVAAAQRLLSRQDGAPPSTAPRTASPRTRQPRAAAANVDAEALIKQVADKIRSQGAAEAERLRVAMRKAIAVLEAAVV